MAACIKNMCTCKVYLVCFVYYIRGLRAIFDFSEFFFPLSDLRKISCLKSQNSNMMFCQDIFFFFIIIYFFKLSLILFHRAETLVFWTYTACQKRRAFHWIITAMKQYDSALNVVPLYKLIETIPQWTHNVFKTEGATIKKYYSMTFL